MRAEVVGEGVLRGWFFNPPSCPQKKLKVLKNRVKVRKETLQAQLAARKSISLQDENWLDHDANLLDEQQALDVLEDASDYERGFERLDEVQKGAVRNLREAAGDLTKVVGSKQKIFTKKENATLAQHIKILDWYHANGENQSKTAKHFDAVYPNLKIKQP
ncbi:hypothetical protein BDR07DRAFT_1382449 [Suillus spraguei]|nr:hypothetical protein BDR07DRAFT_1382449 [Suillus spraguei]